MAHPAQPDEFKVSVDGRVYTIDPLDFTRREWKDLKAQLGMTQIEIVTGVAQFDLDCIAGLVWVTMRRDDPAVELDDIDLRISDIGSDEGDPVPPA